MKAWFPTLSKVTIPPSVPFLSVFCLVGLIGGGFLHILYYCLSDFAYYAYLHDKVNDIGWVAAAFIYGLCPGLLWGSLAGASLWLRRSPGDRPATRSLGALRQAILTFARFGVCGLLMAAFLAIGPAGILNVDDHRHWHGKGTAPDLFLFYWSNCLPGFTMLFWGGSYLYYLISAIQAFRRRAYRKTAGVPTAPA